MRGGTWAASLAATLYLLAVTDIKSRAMNLYYAIDCVEDAVVHARLLGRGMVNGTNWGKLMNDLNLAWYLGHRGWIPTILVLALVALFLAALARLCRRQPSALGRLVCTAITVSLVVETGFNLLCSFIPAANLVLIPFGIPFLTKGAFMQLHYAALCSVFLSACRSGAVLQDESARAFGRLRRMGRGRCLL